LRVCGALGQRALPGFGGGGLSRTVGRLLFESFEDDGCAAFVGADDDGAEEGVVIDF